MSTTMKNLGIDRLSVDEKLDLLHEIWDSIIHETDGTYLSETQRRELERRLAECEKNPEDLVPWSAVKSEAQERLRS